MADPTAPIFGSQDPTQSPHSLMNGRLRTARQALVVISSSFLSAHQFRSATTLTLLCFPRRAGPTANRSQQFFPTFPSVLPTTTTTSSIHNIECADVL